MKIVFRNKLNPEWLKAIEALIPILPEAELIHEPGQAKAQTPLADVLVGGVYQPGELEKAENLKAVIVPFAGVNKLPLKMLAEKKVRVANSHGNAATVAERSLALILAFHARLIPFHNDLTKGIWHGTRGSHANPLQDTWDSIRERTCGFIGMGAIGWELSRLTAAFGCRNLAWRRRVDAAKPDWVERVSDDLDQVLKDSDIICLTIALTPETKGLLSRQRLMNMKDKFLLNISRADLVDEKGLYDALSQGVLKGAGLDVWYRYPESPGDICEPSNYPIHELPNVVLSPHISGFNPYAARRNIKFTLEQIETFVRRGELLSEVDPALGY
jgi:phosphoglycerate dehydrogenase-like enzyme